MIGLIAIAARAAADWLWYFEIWLQTIEIGLLIQEPNNFEGWKSSIWASLILETELAVKPKKTNPTLAWGHMNRQKLSATRMSLFLCCACLAANFDKSSF